MKINDLKEKIGWLVNINPKNIVTATVIGGLIIGYILLAWNNNVLEENNEALRFNITQYKNKVEEKDSMIETIKKETQYDLQIEIEIHTQNAEEKIEKARQMRQDIVYISHKLGVTDKEAEVEILKRNCKLDQLNRKIINLETVDWYCEKEENYKQYLSN